jgi:hypothetical protein
MLFLFNAAEASLVAQSPQIAEERALYSIQRNGPASCVGSKTEIFTAVKIHVPILCVVTTVWSSRSLFYYYYYFFVRNNTESTWDEG